MNEKDNRDFFWWLGRLVGTVICLCLALVICEATIAGTVWVIQEIW